ncbi:PREDICTED: universal stress protein A-like protein [Tarenaya hassleriana]|uniref:universal stress protein A-like protein n=1 Tax=Tarenaya hassleriana TaxID=28532 RepID=UPI00053C25D4|nr:PREDICTED: universal stress protein A-like protein [Tarenaya hassleriana]
MEEEKGLTKKMKKVMVAIDESDCSKRALSWTLEYLKDSILDSEIIVFTAQPPLELSYVYASSYGAAPIELINSMQENHKNAGLNRLEEGKKICAEHGVTPRTVMETGNPKEQICEAVEKLGIDLLVVGSHGRGAIQRTFLGSVSNYCVNNAKCPVLVVRNPA